MRKPASANQLERDIWKVQQARWPRRTVANRIRKLGEEFGELGEALIEYAGAANAPGNPGVTECWQKIREESGDVGIVLADLCLMLGFSLSRAMREKLEKNEARAGTGKGVA